MAITNMIAEGGLQILPLDIVQHVLCLLILIFFMTTLVYNPVLNLIKNRKLCIESNRMPNISFALTKCLKYAFVKFLHA